MAKRPEQIEKGMPTNVDAEAHTLGSILLDDSLYYEAAGKISAEDFSLEKNRKIFRRMTDLKERGERIDRTTLANELMSHGELEACDGLSYIVTLDDGLPMPPHIGSYAKIVKEKSVKRQIIYTAQSLVNRCIVDEERSDAILAGARDTLLTMGADDSDGGPQTPEQIIQGMGGISVFLGPQKKGLPTGFSKYDDMTGGLHDGELTIIAARPGAGKSALALNIAQHASIKLGKTVLFFSLEMSKEQLLNRLVCSVSRVDSQRVRHGYLTTEERRRLAIATGTITSSRLYIDDKSAVTTSGMHARIRRHLAREKVDLVIVDYLQLMSAGRNYENRNQEVTKISRGLKLMAAEIGVPVIALSQLSRATELRKGGGNRPQLSDLRESGSLEQDADVVAFIFREEMYIKDRDDLRGVAELIIGKQRAGPVGTVRLVFMHNITQFANRAEDLGDSQMEMTDGNPDDPL